MQMDDEKTDPGIGPNTLQYNLPLSSSDAFRLPDPEKRYMQVCYWCGVDPRDPRRRRCYGGCFFPEVTGG
jgi:hypothetical protein